MTTRTPGVELDEHSKIDPELEPSRFGLDMDRNQWDRLVTTTLGGTLLLSGLRRRSFGGAVMAATGGWLCYRGVRGTDTFSRVLDVSGKIETAREGVGTVSLPGKSGVSRTITVGKPADELTAYWRDPEHLSRLLSDVVDVSSTGKDRLRLTIDGPLGWGLSWDVQLIEERPDELLRWESLEGSPVELEGSIRFRPAPDDRGTEVTLGVDIDPPGGPIGDAVLASLDIAPKAIVGTALRRFKSLAETGEIPTLDRNPSARGSGDLV